VTERVLPQLNAPAALTEKDLATGLDYLAKCDPDLARIVDKLGPPPMWTREPGFPTMIHMILEQQVSLASARAAYDRLLVAASPLTPRRFLGLDDVRLKAIGFSRQKIVYGRCLSRAILEGRLDLASLDAMDDDSVRSELTRIKGIGAWTADIYLLMALRRPDVWPSSDLALAVAVQRLMGLEARPTRELLDAIAGRWRPWRAVAARLLWHYYLTNGARQGSARSSQIAHRHCEEGDIMKANDDHLIREETLK
jgi:DNA-3-methyladenine glycosylase II